ncbi:right-handed parallel beta-helix repeat-containing protein, partial [Arachidicoccus sp.]|uniref:right-handed parallel beta-helix repeat-containing protein n=1 Tax=Arachidicoccus sp. TaxID=1872624 RepID=UPI003D1DE84E
MILQTIADLKTTDGSTVTNGFANVLGYWNVNDGGGGEFYWDSISTEDDNTGTIFEVSGVITGRWKRLFSGVVNVKWFGVVNGLDFSKGLQNRLNLQKALDLSKVLGGMAINFSKGDYVLDVAVPLNIPSHTTLSGIVGKSMIHIDPATIVNMSTRPYPLTNSSVFFSTDDGNQPLWSNGTSVKNITINGISMTCDYTRGSLPTGYDLKGITILAGTNINITNCNFNNIPQTGIYVNNCNTWKITNNTAIGCGFGHATAPATNNGISTAGQGVSTDLTQQCTSGAISNNICNYNRDEGIQFGFTRGVVITSNVCIGNGDLGIEGDTTYNSSSTEASLGIEIPSQAVISNNYVDGLKQDGTYGKGGIGFAGGNEGIVIISNNLIKNLTGKPAIAANQISGGKCLIDGNFIDRVDPDATQHQISINIEDVTVTNNRFARQGNSNHHADIYIAGTVISADVRNNNSDGNYNFISLYTYQAGLDGILKNINICDNQCKKSISSTVSIRTDLDQAIDIINIERNQFYNLNSSHASNQYGVILTQKVTNDVTINS